VAACGANSVETPDAAASNARQRRESLLDGAIALVALVGLIDAGYLTVEHLSGRSVRCVVTTGCDAVLSSNYATIFGDIPLAALGALAYFTVFSLATLAAFGYGFVRGLLLPLVCVMFAAALWLVYVQAFVLHAFCVYCLVSAALTTTLAALVVTRWFLNRRRRLS
jgi:uncharacterized membrane protein